MKNRFARILACAGLAVLAVAARADDTDNPRYRWNLADLYPDKAAWDADATKVQEALPGLSACQGHLGDSAERLQRCLDLQSDAAKRLTRLFVYANELTSEDTGVPASLELAQRAQVLASKLGEATAFARPEILRLGRDKVQRFIEEDAKLAIYRHPLDDILRAAPHTLDTEGEDLIASFNLSAGAGDAAYQILSNADMPWPTITLSDGTQAKLDQAGYTKYREVENREDRKKVFDAFWGTFHEFERTFGVTFYSNLKEDTVYAKVRKYPDSLHRALDANNVPAAVYDTLIAQTHANLPTLHRYFRLRARMLGIKEMHYYDIYPPLVKSDREYPIAEGEKMMLEAVKPLGADYVAAMKHGLDSRWMDVFPRPRKLSGAHMAGAAYDVHPFLLINYTGNYESVSTIAHEWGHAMHTWLANRAQPYPTSRYPIFIAEIASTCNEALLLDYVLKNAKDDDERLLYLGSALEGLRGTFFRQAMFAEFERDVHARVDKGESLTGAKLTRIYDKILKEYHGDAEGVVKIDDKYAVEWAYIPHFYNSFYVYQYATSIAASSLFAEAILKGEPGARERYLDLLKAGASDYPYELVKRAGVDLATPAPYQALVARMNRIMDEIEAILAKRGK
ncbi:MAG TPA: oligoendopeptidase F [Usitatibacter sp.]|nr:oligoendopeptidase F [Usitatibacter sp.]